ncbi:sigma-70 family RNA polymerase sigma factor [Streptomyces cinnamoneus]|uniref:BACON domain-containing protein n=1 Tax=Streptomyces cinnamoneus TaxID=53446 RepID=UPI00344A5BDD
MMTSRPEPPTHATGAHRASRRAPRAAQPPVAEPVEHAPHGERPAPGGTETPGSAGSPPGLVDRPDPVDRPTLVDRPGTAARPGPAARSGAAERQGTAGQPTFVDRPGTAVRSGPAAGSAAAVRSGAAERQGTAGQPDVVAQPGPATSPGTAENLPERYEPHLDGLFTYCLSVLCDHDAAVAALGEVLALAERRTDRAPAAEEAHRAWLYALARWECLRRLAERGAGPGPGPRSGEPAPDADSRARAELALLAWPEAAGTTAEQREALELAVRHGLAPHEVAAVLRLDHDAARALLSSAACEVERTRTALAVVESGRCPVVSRFVGETEVLLGAALRRELVRHVDECADCRRTAERANAGEPWPGTAASTAALPVLEAPRAAAHSALAHALGTRPQRRRAAARATPRFDRGGFPLAPKDRAARRGRMRTRAVTTTVVATVVAAPLLALWAAYRGGPEGQGAASVSATETDSLGGGSQQGTYDDPYAAPYGPSGPTRSSTGTGAPTPATVGHRFSEVSVAVIGPDGRPVPVAAPPAAGATPPAAAGAVPLPAAPGRVTGPGRLTVEAQPSGTATIVKLTASGGEPVSWSMSADAPWLRLSQPGGVLYPGRSVTVTVYVDHGREPAGRWSARVAVAPGGSVVTIEGCGAAPQPSPSSAHPSTPPPSAPAPTPEPSRTGG